MKTKLFYVTLLGMSILLGSCANDNLQEPESGKKNLNIQATIGEITSRAPIASFSNASEMGLFITAGNLGNDYDGIAAYSNVKATVNNNAWSLAIPVYLSNNTAKIYAYYPYSASTTTGTTVPIETTSQTDFLYGTHVASVNNTTPNCPITMQHVLALVDFKFAKQNYSGTGKLTKIEIANASGKKLLNNKGTINIQTGAITKDATTSGDTSRTLDYTLTTTAAATSADPFLVIPVSPLTSAGDLTMTFTVDGKAYVYNLPAATEWVSGTKNTYAVTLSGKGLTVGNVTITDWTTGTGGAATIQ